MHATELAHKRPALTAQHRENFRKLADYVLNLPDDYKGFSMVDYCSSRRQDTFLDIALWEAKKTLADNECGTTACMLGHGPSAGIPPSREGMDWCAYAADFGCQPEGGTRSLWNWAFSGEWTYCAPTRADAAMRVHYMLDYGIPENFRNPGREWAELVKESYEVK